MINKDISRHVQHQGFDEEEMYGAYKIFFGTMVSEQRLKIIKLLMNGKKNVSELVDELKTDQTAVSHNLERLRRCGFVYSEVDGKYRYYKLNDKTIKPLMSLIEKHMSQYCVHILRTVKENQRFSFNSFSSSSMELKGGNTK